MKHHEQTIDWLKAVAISLIVLGHVGLLAPFNEFTYPIYPKQIGVALFMFVLGWNLARDCRGSWQIFFQRMFPMYFFGLLCVLAAGIPVFLFTGNVQLSNLLPFLLGAHVFFDFYPANPALWFVGTYFHAVLFWFILAATLRVRPWHMLLFLGLEVLARATLMDRGMDHVAYMMLFSWLTPFLMGALLHGKGDLSPAIGKVLVPCLVLGVFALAWWFLFSHMALADRSFPFRKWPGGMEGFPQTAFLSLLVSVQYIFYPLVLFLIFQRLPCPGPVSFLARQTLVIFLAHMPLIFVLAPLNLPGMESAWLKRTFMAFLCLPGLALVSEGATRMVRLPEMQRHAWATLQKLTNPSGASLGPPSPSSAKAPPERMNTSVRSVEKNP